MYPKHGGRVKIDEQMDSFQKGKGAFGHGSCYKRHENNLVNNIFQKIMSFDTCICTTLIVYWWLFSERHMEMNAMSSKNLQFVF